MSTSKVLLVDDNDDLRSFLVLLLRRYAGYDILEAATGEAAIETAISEKPDLIVLDITLPDMSGIGAIKGLKNNPSTAEIPIIVYSGLPLLGWKEQALNAGSAAFLK
jgi:CheY-like chemotaxis protein